MAEHTKHKDVPGIDMVALRRLLSVHEITQKHRLGKWPEVSDIVERLPHLLCA